MKPRKMDYWWNEKNVIKMKEKRLPNNWLTTRASEDRKRYSRINKMVKKQVIKRKNEIKSKNKN